MEETRIVDLARRLGRAISESPSFAAYREAHERLSADTDAKELTV